MKAPLAAQESMHPWAKTGTPTTGDPMISTGPTENVKNKKTEILGAPKAYNADFVLKNA